MALLLVLAALVPLLVAATIVQHRENLNAEDGRLSSGAEEQAEGLVEAFERTNALTRILAHNPAFLHVYEARDQVGARSNSVREANEALAQLEQLFPGQIAEAGFIDRSGAEVARAVRGRIAPPWELSDDRTGAIFFRPAFALDPGSVYQSKPYVSRDTNEWVITNAAPISRLNGITRAIVHFELTLESIRRSAVGSGDYTIQIVERATGRILVDTRYPQDPDAPLVPKGRIPLPRELSAGHLTDQGYRAAFRVIPAGVHNANRWTVVARSTKPRPTWVNGQTGWQLAILAFVLAIFPLALVNWLRGQRSLQAAADTDPLTGLGNRRHLTSTLDGLVTSAKPERPLMLALYDLDGFKHYNDTFGHPAGDALLKRLAEKLVDGIDGKGEVFRMGGDEFCVVARPKRPEDAQAIAEAGAEALQERGEGFAVRASFGVVLVPTDAESQADALRLADQRMYAQKGSSRMSASRQAIDALTLALAERDPELGQHGFRVAELAEETALRMGASPEEAEEIRRAGVLHDLGKLSIPESILEKPGPLTEDEWAFVVTHTIVGERIIAAAPALAGVARLVRSSHEAWDGSGYPDGLRETETPLGSRIVAVCDAFEAMISDRPYRPALTVEEALAELRRCAGTQFDPSVVANFCTIVAARSRVAAALTA